MRPREHHGVALQLARAEQLGAKRRVLEVPLLVDLA